MRSYERAVDELADEIVWLVRSIEHDLYDEDRAMASDVVSRDQTDG